LLLPAGPVKRIVEGDDKCGIARVAGITLRAAGLAAPPSTGTTGLGECVGWESEGGSACRASGPVERSRAELVSSLSESGNGGVVVAEADPIGAMLGVVSSGRVPTD
jgi:hypothetical protein